MADKSSLFNSNKARRRWSRWATAVVLVMTIAVAALAGIAGTSRAAPAPDDALASAQLVTAAPCASLTSLALPNTTIISAVETPAGTVPGPPPGALPTAVPATCRAHATVTRPGTSHQIGVDVWMPASGWNGRFQGVGGFGFTTGSPNSLAGPVAAGFSAAVTDGGHGGLSNATGSFALDSSGHYDWELIQEFSYRALHDVAVMGKAVTAAYYGKQAEHAYFNGCSTGGRQALALAQRYPEDFDGILAAAPAINLQKMAPAMLWPQLVMLRDGKVLPQCKFAAFQAAAIQACDEVGDGVVDGVIGDPLACTFDPSSLVGTTTTCGTITAQDAAVVAKIVAGPRTADGESLWHGLTWGAAFGGPAAGFTGGLANTVPPPSGTTQAPFGIALAHLGTWVQQTPPVGPPFNGTWDWTTTTYDRYDQLFQQSVELFSDVIGTDDPDLSAFKEAGGKIVIWHGLADQLVFPQGSIDYYRHVRDLLGGKGTKRFARLFLAPGVAHCSGGAGPQPDDPLAAVIEWVEKGEAPKTLNGVVRNANGFATQSRPICMYPSLAVYGGNGSADSASSFKCNPSRAR
jgi:pimeloyl-ACP methyl ester carboxylesterase